jgi:biopolymer transport protein ExbB
VKHLAAFLRDVPIWLIVAALVAGLGAACVAQTTAPSPTQPAGTEDEGRMSFLQLMLAGRYFMIPIGLCSLMGLAVIIERVVALRRGAVIPGDFMPALKSSFRHDSLDRDAGVQFCRARSCPIARVTEAGIRKLHRGEEAVESAIEDAGSNEVSRLRRNLRLLYGVAAVAPMLGLLGTVWGMIEAFQVASDPNVDVTNRGPLLGKGIYEALVTTFAGLTVAIPALIFYYFFLGRIDRLVYDMNEASVEFVEHYMGRAKTEG